MNMYSIHSRLWVVFAGLFLMTIAPAPAQVDEPGADGPPPRVSVSGNASIDVNAYGLGQSAGGTAPQRRPDALLRLVFSPTISFGDHWTMPCNIILTTPETSTIEPQPRHGSLSDFVQNPANCLSLAPRFDWAQFTLGTQTPNMSELSGGNIQVFGFGVDLAPGKFRLAASAGAVGRSVAADTAFAIRGAYARQAYMGRLAYVNGRMNVGLNLVRIRDDGASIPNLVTSAVLHPDPADPSIADTISVRDPLMPLPEESFTATVNAAVPIAEGVDVRAEIGGSLFTRDMNAGEISEPIGEIEPLMAQRLSTRADLAGKVAVGIAREKWGVTLSSSYIGPGYRTLAYPWMQADHLDVTAAPHVNLLAGDLQLSGSIGWQQNNLARTEEATTSQLLGSASVAARIGDGLTINAQYSNYGMRTPVRNDTFRVETVSQSIGIAPTVTLASDAVTHTMTASVGIDDYSDYNPVTGAAGTNRTRSVAGSYSATLNAIPLNIDVSGSWMVNRLSIGNLRVTSGSIGAGYRLFAGDLTLGAGCSLTRSELAAGSPDEGMTLRLNTNVRITKQLRLRADASIVKYHYGDARPGASFSEHFLRTSLQWGW